MKNRRQTKKYDRSSFATHFFTTANFWKRGARAKQDLGTAVITHSLSSLSKRRVFKATKSMSISLWPPRLRTGPPVVSLKHLATSLHRTTTSLSRPFTTPQRHLPSSMNDTSLRASSANFGSKAFPLKLYVALLSQLFQCSSSWFTSSFSSSMSSRTLVVASLRPRLGLPLFSISSSSGLVQRHRRRRTPDAHNVAVAEELAIEDFGVADSAGLVGSVLIFWKYASLANCALSFVTCLSSPTTSKSSSLSRRSTPPIISADVAGHLPCASFFWMVLAFHAP